MVQPKSEYYCCYSVAKYCPALCDTMGCSTPIFPVLHYLSPGIFFRLMSIESVMPSSHLVLYHSLLLLPSIFPSITVFSNELVLRIRWSKYLSFIFSISPFNEYSGLIPLGLTGLISMPSRRLESLLQHHNLKGSIL